MEKTFNFLENMFKIIKTNVTTNTCAEYMFPLLSLVAVEQNQNLYTIPEHALWSNLIKTGNRLSRRTNQALEEIAAENENLKEVLTVVSYAAYDDVALHNLLLQIDEIPVPEFGRLADEIILEDAMNAGRSGGNLTPYIITDLKIRLLDIRDDSSVHDATAGFAQSLIRATQFANDLALNGQEIDKKTWALAKMNALLHGNVPIDLRLGDTIRNPAFIDEENGLQTFDYIIMDPPYGLENWGYETAKVDIYGRFFYGIPPKSRGDMGFVLHLLASLNERGKAAVLIPNGVLFRGGSEEKIREELIRLDLIESVIALPVNLLYSATIPVSLLLLNKQKPASRKEKILFIDAQEEYEQERRQRRLTEKSANKINKIFHQGLELEKFSKWIQNEEISTASLDVNHYFDEEEIEVSIGKVQINRDTYEQSKTIALKSVATLFRGMNPRPSKYAEGQCPTHRLIELSHVHGGKIEFESLELIEAQSIRNVSNYELQAGDIIVSSRGTTIKIAVVPKLQEPTIISNHFICIRPEKGLNTHFLKVFLESPLGMFYLVNSQKGTAVTILTNKDIENIPVPDLPRETQDKIAAGFIESNRKYEKHLKEIQTQHRNEYEILYSDMGLAGAYQRINES